MKFSLLCRFTATETSLSLGTVTGYYLSSLISTQLGNKAVLLLSAGSLLLAAAYAALRLENILPEGEVRVNSSMSSVMIVVDVTIILVRRPASTVNFPFALEFDLTCSRSEKNFTDRRCAPLIKDRRS